METIHQLHEPGAAVRNVADLDGNYYQQHEPGTAVKNVADLDGNYPPTA